MAEQMKFCRNCGQQISASAKFCKFCGYSFEAPEPQPEQLPAQPAQPAAQLSTQERMKASLAAGKQKMQAAQNAEPPARQAPQSNMRERMKANFAAGKQKMQAAQQTAPAQSAQPTVFCINCVTPLSAGAAFCKNCGQPVGGAPFAAEAAYQNPVYSFPSAPQPVYGTRQNVTPIKGKKSGGFSFVNVLLVAAIAVLAFFIWRDVPGNIREARLPEPSFSELTGEERDENRAIIQQVQSGTYPVFEFEGHDLYDWLYAYN